MLGLLGPACLVAAAASAVLALNAPVDVPLGAHVLRLLDRDLAGLAAVLAAAGAAGVVAAGLTRRRWRSAQRGPSGLRFAITAAAIFVVLFAALLIAWPAPPIRLQFVPADAAALVEYRLYVRGLKHGRYALEAEGPPMLIASAGEPDGAITCAIRRTWSFGPFGWARDLAPMHERDSRAEGAPPVDSQGLCVNGIDLSSVTADVRARELLKPFVFDGRLTFTRDQIAAAEGSNVDPDALDVVGRYLLFKRSPERAATTYEAADHVYAAYRCDAAYARFLVSRGVPAPGPLLVPLQRIRDGELGVITDARPWQGRVDPVEILRGGSDPHISLSEAVAGPECGALLAFYERDDAARAITPSRRP